MNNSRNEKKLNRSFSRKIWRMITDFLQGWSREEQEPFQENEGSVRSNPYPLFAPSTVPLSSYHFLPLFSTSDFNFSVNNEDLFYPSEKFYLKEEGERGLPVWTDLADKEDLPGDPENIRRVSRTITVSQGGGISLPEADNTMAVPEARESSPEKILLSELPDVMETEKEPGRLLLSGETGKSVSLSTGEAFSGNGTGETLFMDPETESIRFSVLPGNRQKRLIPSEYPEKSVPSGESESVISPRNTLSVPSEEEGAKGFSAEQDPDEMTSEPVQKTEKVLTLYEQALQRLNSSPLPGWMEKSVPGISEERDALQAGRRVDMEESFLPSSALHTAQSIFHSGSDEKQIPVRDLFHTGADLQNMVFQDSFSGTGILPVNKEQSTENMLAVKLKETVKLLNNISSSCENLKQIIAEGLSI